MKIACVDKTATDRLRLQEHFEAAYEQCRSALGHLTVAQIIPSSKEEVLLSSPPDAIAIGPAFPVEEAYSQCREIREAHPDVSLFVFLPAETYSLRSLRRFEKMATEIFAPTDSPTRLIHAICRLQEKRNQRSNGKLFVVEGVKGGVGATSIVGGLAHAAETLGKTAVLVDLSAAACLIHYMGGTRWQSADYATALTDGLPAERSLVERLLSTAPNGVTLLLPPAGGNDIRDLWLRDSKRFELTLSLVELLKDMFDIVFVDCAGAEGVLPFALSARAQGRLLVTSNDPASVHLLNGRLSDLHHVPGDCPVYILANLLLDRGLTKEDIVDFLLLNKNYNDEMSRLRPVPFESQGRNWIGSGNTFYTESSRSAQLSLELCLTKLLNPSYHFSVDSLTSAPGEFFTRLFERLPVWKLPAARAQKKVPLLTSESTGTVTAPVLQPAKTPLGPAGTPLSSTPALDLLATDLYQPPKLVVNNR